VRLARTIAVALALVVASGPLVGRTQASGGAKLVAEFASISPGADRGSIDLILDLPKVNLKPWLIRPSGDSAPRVTLDPKVDLLSGNKTGRGLLRLHLKVEKLPPLYTQLWALSFGSTAASPTVAFTISNDPKGTVLLTVQAPASIHVAPGEWTPVVVSTGATRLTKLTLAPFTLSENHTHTAYAGGYPKLCNVKAHCKDDEVAELQPFSNTVLWVAPAEWAGEFDGVIDVRADQLPAGVRSGQTAIFVSSGMTKAFGFGLMAIGFGLSFFVGVGLRAAAARDRWLLKASQLQAELDELGRKLRLQANASRAVLTAEKLQQGMSQLGEDALKQRGLPDWLGPFFLADTDKADLQAYMQAQAVWVEALTIVIEDGLAVVDRQFRDAPSRAARGAAAALYADVDRLADGSWTPAPAADALHAKIDGMLHPQPASSLSLLDVRVQAQLPRVEVLRRRLGLFNTLGWMFSLSTTLLVGAYVILFSNAAPSFGSVGDLFGALLWGLGVPTGTQIAQGAVAGVVNGWRQP
jgi:hypothetical protein